ncbi:MAG: adenosylhomocysteinase [Candidatus Methanomethylicota archaeon]|uniref:Adenosylhomocysteinase n=1 Tax=Thermoproteota archaeon TaxID=2056631 RepID=A0A497F0T9_9CREN|nr:MAG: adenosylhomocysteinase [Candidatus Verstraetearchaeota archaeon]RLE53076.1 MAG: adenosylhomocysteinase [Candidatus Verstraetearchaeota archaeon]
MNYKVKDLSLAEKGRMQIEWAEARMPVLMKIREKFKAEKPLEGLKISACLHVTKETAVLVKTLAAGGAKVALSASNPLSTQDEVAAALVEEGISVYAWRGQSEKEYFECIELSLKHMPDITMDDGADLTVKAHMDGYAEGVIGGTEETTTGVIRLKAMEKQGALKYPIIAVNDAHTKYLFDNRYGTGQSTIDGIMRATNVLLAGKTVVVAGYGWCGRGIAIRAKGMGANVIVTEVNPLRALEAVMDGFRVMPMSKAAEVGDIFITATGNINIIRKEHMLKMKSGAILANSGHFNVEINLKDLESISTSKRKVRPNVEEYTLTNGRKLYLLGEGRLVNLVAAEGHPSEVMDMSFSNQALSVKYLAEKGRELKPAVYKVPEFIDVEVAKLKLESIGVEIDELTEEQKQYLQKWES